MDLKPALSITFGECVETHAGMQQTGHIRDVGYTVQELRDINNKYKDCCELIMLSNYLPVQHRNGNEAAVLVIRNGLQLFGIDKNKLYQEQINLNPDTKAYMRGKVVNKQARYNLCYADFYQQADYESGKGTIIDFKQVSELNKLRSNLSTILGYKSKELNAELNVYYDINKCGIGFHGDTERKIVICVRLGSNNPLQYQWFIRSRPICKCGLPINAEDKYDTCKCFKPVMERVNLELNDGDMYIMSDKAVGFDWKRSSIYTLRHAAGCNKYLQTKYDKDGQVAIVNGKRINLNLKFKS